MCDTAHLSGTQIERRSSSSQAESRWKKAWLLWDLQAEVMPEDRTKTLWNEGGTHAETKNQTTNDKPTRLFSAKTRKWTRPLRDKSNGERTRATAGIKKWEKSLPIVERSLEPGNVGRGQCECPRHIRLKVNYTIMFSWPKLKNAKFFLFVDADGRGLPSLSVRQKNGELSIIFWGSGGQNLNYGKGR